VKRVGHKTDMRILLSVNPLRHDAKKRPSVLPVAAALVACLGLSACVGKQPDAWQQDKPSVLASMQKLQDEQQSMKSAQQSMQGVRQSMRDEIDRLQKHMAEIEQKQVENSAMINAQHTSIRQLQTSTVHLKAIAAKSKKTSRMTKQKLVKKLDKIAKSISTPVAASPVQPKEKEKNHYTAAYLALKSGRYDEASQGFRSLLKEFPKGEFLDQAWYWLGESYYAQHKLKQAIAAFETVVRRYPKSAKHAAALLRLGLTYQDASRPKNARSTLQRLIRKHPDSAAAEQARHQLRAMLKKEQ